MQNNKKNTHDKKPLDKALSIDARDIATSFDQQIFSRIIPKDDAKAHLEIVVISTTDKYQEVEITYGKKKIRRRIPRNLVDAINLIIEANKPSAKMGAVNSGKLAHALQSDAIVLQEKFLRILATINHVSEIKTAEKIWDSEERINTAEKAILLAVVNSMRPENERLDRVIVSQRSYEISDQEAFKKLISDVLDLVKNPQKLMPILFGHAAEKLSDEKKSGLTNYLKSIISETDDSKRNHQMGILKKIVNEASDDKQTSRNSF